MKAKKLTPYVFLFCTCRCMYTCFVCYCVQRLTFKKAQGRLQVASNLRRSARLSRKLGLKSAGGRSFTGLTSSWKQASCTRWGAHSAAVGSLPLAKNAVHSPSSIIGGETNKTGLAALPTLPSLGSITNGKTSLSRIPWEARRRHLCSGRWSTLPFFAQA